MFLVDQSVVITCCQFPQGVLEVAEIQHHTTHLPCFLKRFLADENFYRPAVAVQVGALALIAGQKMSAVKSCRCF